MCFMSSRHMIVLTSFSLLYFQFSCIKKELVFYWYKLFLDQTSWISNDLDKVTSILKILTQSLKVHSWNCHLKLLQCLLNQLHNTMTSVVDYWFWVQKIRMVFAKKEIMGEWFWLAYLTQIESSERT